LPPQASSVPSARRANAKLKPGPTAMASRTPATYAGSGLHTFVPSPRLPELFCPKAQTEPSARPASLLLAAPSIPTTLDRVRAARGGASGRVRELVRAPGPEGSRRQAVGLEGEGVTISGADPAHAGQGPALHRSGARGRAPVAELTGLVVAPGPDRAVRLQGQAVRVAARHRHHACQAADLGRRRARRGCRSVSDLTGCVVAPRRGRAVGSPRQVVVAPGRAGGPLGQPADLLRSGHCCP